jgi:1-acyl-sn-glycerol-3-phosphate acyltransferase
MNSEGVLDWRYDTAPDSFHPLKDRMRCFPRQPDMLVYGTRLAAAAAARVWVRSYHRLKVIGRDNLPSGSYVLVANHSSHLDALCLLAALPLRNVNHVFSAAASDYFFATLSRTAAAVIFANAFPFDRTVHCGQSLHLCSQLLAISGNVLIMFPEGTRTTTGEVGAFRSGIGALVVGTTVPVVPCRLTGTFPAWPKGTHLPRPRRVTLAIGTPRTYSNVAPDRMAAHRIAQELRDAVLALEVGDDKRA